MPRTWLTAITRPVVVLALVTAPVGMSRPAVNAFRSPADEAAATDPAAVVAEATHAVERGEAASARARYAARLGRDASDRAAALGLATISRLTYDFGDAEQRLGALFVHAPTSDPYAVYARLGLAQSKEAHGNKQGLQALLDTARAGARVAHAAAAEGEAHFWMAHSLAGVYGGGFALAHLDSALHLVPASAPALQAMCRCRRAQIEGVVGVPGARDSLAAAHAFANRIGEASAQGICWRGLGTYQEIHGAVDSSLAAYDSLIALRHRTHDRSNLAVALTLRADVMRSSGDFGGGLRVFREALSEARASKNLYIEASVTLGLGGTSLTLNDHVSAAAQVSQAIQAFEAANDSAGAMLARSFLPFISLAAGDYPLARRQVQAVMPWAQGVEDWGHVEELYTQLASIEMRARDWPAAERALRDAAVAARRLGATKERLLAFPRGRLALYRGDLTGAQREFAAYLGGLDSSQHLQRYETRAYLADVFARRGALAAAERELTAAGAELDEWRARLSDKELRLMVFQAGASEANDRNASVARVLAALAAGGRTDASFALAERRRARELTERLTRVAALRSESGRDSVTPRSTERSTSSVQAGPGIAASTGGVLPTLPDDRTAVLEYVTGSLGSPTTLFVVAPPRATGGGPVLRAHVLEPADSLIDDIARFTALVEQGSDVAAPARRLAIRLLDSALADLGDGVTRLIVVPDGPLHRVPWDALRTSDGHFIVERYAVSLAPSAGVLRELWRRPASTKMVRLLAYGDPAFATSGSQRAREDHGSDAELYRSAFDSAGGLPRLAASAREAALVARYAQEAELRIGERASAAYLKHAPLGQFRVLHLATHALVDEHAATRTALAVAPGQGESGFLSPSDLAALHLDADLVVLSACRSAGGVVIDGEGVEGLTAPLLEAGARSVVATRWRIGDRSTVAFVDDFYRAMAEGRSIGEALREAKVAALRRGAPTSEWAAFTVMGDPLLSIPLRAPPPRTRAWLLALGLVAAATGAYGALTRRRPSAELR